MAEGLGEIFKVQKEFEALFVDFKKVSEDPQYLDKIADYLSTGLAREAFEYRDEFNWKVSKRARPHNRDKQIEEAVDCFIFSVNMLLILGIEADEATEWILTKIRMNWDRQVAEGNPIAVERVKSANMEM